MHIISIAILTLIFLVLNGFLWYVRPNANLWLFGSLCLGGIWGFVFLRLITSSGTEKTK
jgi:hypothetical protein